MPFTSRKKDRSEFGRKESRGIGRSFGRAGEFGKRVRQAGISLAISLDGGGNDFDVGESVLLVGADGGPVPFDFEGRKI